MKQCKIIDQLSIIDFEQELNQFLAKNNINILNVLDIGRSRFTILIIYELKA